MYTCVDVKSDMDAACVRLVCSKHQRDKLDSEILLVSLDPESHRRDWNGYQLIFLAMATLQVVFVWCVWVPQFSCLTGSYAPDWSHSPCVENTLGQCYLKYEDPSHTLVGAGCPCPTTRVLVHLWVVMDECYHCWRSCHNWLARKESCLSLERTERDT